MLQSVPGTNQFYAKRQKLLAQENNGTLWWCSNPCLPA